MHGYAWLLDIKEKVKENKTEAIIYIRKTALGEIFIAGMKVLDLQLWRFLFTLLDILKNS